MGEATTVFYAKQDWVIESRANLVNELLVVNITQEYLLGPVTVSTQQS